MLILTFFCQLLSHNKVKCKIITSHVAGPLVALEVELSSGLSNVLCSLPLLDLAELFLGIFT